MTSTGLRPAYMRQVHVRNDAIYTPASITHTMVALLADHAAKGNATVSVTFPGAGLFRCGSSRLDCLAERGKDPA
jgi:hypothetical protein